MTMAYLSKLYQMSYRNINVYNVYGRLRVLYAKHQSNCNVKQFALFENWLKIIHVSLEIWCRYSTLVSVALCRISLLQ